MLNRKFDPSWCLIQFDISRQSYFVTVRNKTVLEALPEPPKCKRVIYVPPSFHRLCWKPSQNRPNARELLWTSRGRVWKALEEVLPGKELRGCSFHSTQAVMRHVQEVGLQRAYRQDRGTHHLVKKLMALCFMPATHISSLYGRVERKASTRGNEKINALLTYFRKTWVESQTWRPATWSVFNSTMRTNNDVEDWHARLNKRGRQQMPFYLFVALLKGGSRFDATPGWPGFREKTKQAPSTNIPATRTKDREKLEPLP